MGIQIDVAELAGIVCEGIFYGLFLSLSAATLHILIIGRQRNSKLNVPMTIAAMVMLVLATAQIIVDTVNVFMAFVVLDRPERLRFLLDVTQRIFAAKHAIYFTMMLVGDSIVIYRAFVVWNHNFWVIIVPVLCSLGSAVSAYQTIWAVRHIASASIKGETSWGIAVFALSLCANGIATSLIAYRIWTHNRVMSSFGESWTSKSSSLAPVFRIVLESGLINAAYLMAYLIVLRSGSHGLEVMACISTPLIGIIFSVVIIRAALASNRGASNSSTTRIPVPVFHPQTRSNTAVELSQWSVENQEPYYAPKSRGVGLQE
ncbi:hypothetical protein EW146_g8787 [Bondarzewia mesenterica]|uniref:G-protein coupled receptors family 1 profile domain-containing protein n=1 Tax=Bondarzewia mesenterica TaxID=1095465 RepID=A0A4V3XDB6_9AGAM|nr:hypothetical protein EW146_g8787 [Bondarzewia mesenterica]